MLEVRSLRCEREDRLLFADLDFAVDAGDVVQVTGPNGAGKTTLLRGIAGLSSRCQGTILWHGAARDEVVHRFRAEVLYIGHEAGVKLPLTPLENLRWNCAMWPGSTAEREIRLALERVSLTAFEQMPCQHLSAGQRRRVALARLLLSPAKLWILDEPFTAIDVHGISAIEELLLQHTRDGGAVLLTTHQRLRMDRPVLIVDLSGKN